MKAYLIPGSGENLQSRDYAAILEAYRQQGYEPQFLSITWKYKTIDDWVRQVQAQVTDDDLRQSLVSGFSFGAMIALTVAAKVNPKQLLLFSLSPYFQEDMPLPAKWEQWVGKRRVDNFRRLSFDDLAARIHCPTVLFGGSLELERYKNMQKRIDQAHKKISGSQSVVIDGVAHDAAHPAYVKAIKQALVQ
jgi:esterase/lipase